MAVPPEAPARRDPVGQDMHVGGFRRLHRRAPIADFALRIEASKGSDTEDRRLHVRGWCRGDGLDEHGDAQGNGEKSKQQFQFHLSSSSDEMASTTRIASSAARSATRTASLPDGASNTKKQISSSGM